MLIKDKDISSYQLLLIKHDRSCFFDKRIFFFFFHYIDKKWVGRAMGNETIYWNGLGCILVTCSTRNLTEDSESEISFCLKFPFFSAMVLKSFNNNTVRAI